MMPSTPTERSWFIRKTAAAQAAAAQRGDLLRLEAALDPLRGLHAFRRVHLLGRIALHVHHGNLAALHLGLAVGRFHDRLVAVADRHAYLAAGTLERQALQRGRHLLGRRALAAV